MTKEVEPNNISISYLFFLIKLMAEKLYKKGLKTLYKQNICAHNITANTYKKEEEEHLFNHVGNIVY